MKIICKLREWLKIKPVHSYKRHRGSSGSGIRVCQRCNFTVPVKHRTNSKAKAASHEQLRANLSGITDVMRGRKSREDV